MRHPLKSTVAHQKKFSAPNASVHAIARAVPRNSEHWRFDRVFRHAGKNMRIMMLHGNAPRAAPARELRRKIIRMQITGDSRGPGVIKRRQVLRAGSKRQHRSFRLQVSDMLAEEHLGADSQRYRIFEMSAHRQHSVARCAYIHWQWRIS